MSTWPSLLVSPHAPGGRVGLAVGVLVAVGNVPVGVGVSVSVGVGRVPVGVSVGVNVTIGVLVGPLAVGVAGIVSVGVPVGVGVSVTAEMMGSRRPRKPAAPPAFVVSTLEAEAPARCASTPEAFVCALSDQASAEEDRQTTPFGFCWDAKADEPIDSISNVISIHPEYEALCFTP